MNCKSVQAYLSAYLDGELCGHESMAVRDHLNRCAECEMEERQLRSLKHLLQGLPSYQPAPGFEDRLVANVRSADRRRQFGFRFDWRLAGGFAMASVLVMVGVVMSDRRAPAASPDPGSIARMDSISLDMTRDQLFISGNDPLSGNRFASYGTYGED
jgi:anti-sigma factor RsiW